MKPILTRVLGWSYSVQTDATHFGRRNRTDYALFPSEEVKRAAQAAGADGRLDYSRAAAVGDAKFWGRPLDRKLRDDWEGWLGEGSTEHDWLTAEIVRLETELNERVYALFDLTAEEIRIIEESTKYRYGEV